MQVEIAARDRIIEKQRNELAEYKRLCDSMRIELVQSQDKARHLELDLTNTTEKAQAMLHRFSETLQTIGQSVLDLLDQPLADPAREEKRQALRREFTELKIR